MWVWMDFRRGALLRNKRGHFQASQKKVNEVFTSRQSGGALFITLPLSFFFSLAYPPRPKPTMLSLQARPALSAVAPSRTSTKRATVVAAAARKEVRRERRGVAGHTREQGARGALL